MAMRYVVAFYELDRHYGGPEEGGWWYDTGQLERVHRIFRTESAANACCARANSLLRHQQRNNVGIGSMGYRGGEYVADVFKNTAPERWSDYEPYH